jgi:hypothetical protein
MKCIDLNVFENNIFFDNGKAFISPTQYIYVFLMILRMNSDYLTLMTMTINIAVSWDMSSYSLLRQFSMFFAVFMSTQKIAVP